jgi:hypothetical protein
LIVIALAVIHNVLDGYGPIPASLAQRLVRDAVVDKRAVATLRRLYRHPNSGSLVGMESRARLFPKGLAGFIALRDRTCRTPYCDAPASRSRGTAQPRWPNQCRQWVGGV